MSRIRVAAIGVGHWHSLFDAAYLKTLVRMSDAELVGIQDADAALAAQRGSELGAPPAFSDYHEMLARTRPEFVIVLGRHCEMAASADYLLDEGYPFLIEKPAGVDAREVQGIAAKAAAKRAFAAVPLFQRLHPFVAHARRMIDAGELGLLSHFYFRSNRPSSARYVAWGAPWMLDPALAGGGCLRNIGLHGIDLFIHLTGEEPEVTGAQSSSRALGQPVEDYATVLLRTASGLVATIEVGNTFPGKGADAEWKLAGRDALLAHRGAALRWTTASGDRELPAEIPEPLPAAALRDALARFRRGEPPAASLQDCYRAMRVVDAAYALAKRGVTPS
ncbi:MAG TPA: Gfo/Idh/MocA family oxidoreductase [Burkholderiales bacterium]|nr:Gfo/Idh/MocA family oxidoreductase [Burkholderiales bacterium]